MEKEKNPLMNEKYFCSQTDSINLLKNGLSFEKISLYTIDLKTNYSEMLNLIFQQKYMNALTIYTEYNPSIDISSIRTSKLTELKYLYLSIEKKNQPFDYLKIIIQNTPNIETLIHDNGLLTKESMKILTKLSYLKTLVITNAKITDFKEFGSMHFNLNVHKMAYSIDYSVY